MRLRRILIYSIFFALGFFTHRVITHRVQGPSQSTSSQTLVEEKVVDQIQITQSHPRAQKYDRIKGTRGLPHTQNPSPVPVMTPAELEQELDAMIGDYPMLDENSEIRLVELISLPIPAEVEFQKTVNGDGSVDELGSAANGQQFFRHIDSEGHLVHEGWNTPAGESVFRSYYSPRGIRDFNWTRADKGFTSVGFSQSGKMKHRVDQSPDGISASINFDERGQVQDVWRSRKGQSAIRVWPEVE